MRLKHISSQSKKRPNITSTRDSKFIQGPQSQKLYIGAAQELCGCEHISAGLVFMPPSKVAKPHLHKYNELIIFFIEGWGAVLLGDTLDEILYFGPGDFLFVPEGVVHLGVNLSDTHRIIALETRTDPKFNEDVIVFPKLEKKANTIAADLRKKFSAGSLLPEAKKLGFGPFTFQEQEIKTNELPL